MDYVSFLKETNEGNLNAKPFQLESQTITKDNKTALSINSHQQNVIISFFRFFWIDIIIIALCFLSPQCLEKKKKVVSIFFPLLQLSNIKETQKVNMF